MVEVLFVRVFIFSAKSLIVVSSGFPRFTASPVISENISFVRPSMRSSM